MYKPWQEGNRLHQKLQDAKARQDWNAVAEVDKELAHIDQPFKDNDLFFLQVLIARLLLPNSNNGRD